jgi:hypothetical protein
VSNDRAINNEHCNGKGMEESGRGQILDIILAEEELRKTTKNLSQDNRTPGRNLNPGPSEYQTEVLTTRLRRSVEKLDTNG